MADKSTELERIYTIPLRRAKHGTRSKRADRAVDDVRNFLTRHMKSQSIWIAGEVNESLWGRGKFTIPSKIRVRATRFDDGVVEVTLPDMEAEGSVREAIAERQEEAAEAPVLAPMGMEGAEGETADAATMAVEDVDGIGPATAEKLEAEGIETVADMLEAGEARVAEIVGREPEGVDQWFSHARVLAEGGHEAADLTSEGGAELPVTDIDGIGAKMAEQLEAEGITTVEDFLDAGIDKVADALGRDADGVDQFFAHARDIANATVLDDSEE